MSKRFTETEKWEDSWFAYLTPTTKLFWIFLLDKVDDSGVWKKDQRRLNFETGMEIDIQAFFEDLGDRVIDLEDRILIPGFVQFQQGRPLTEKVRFHQRILKLLNKHGLEQDGKGQVRVCRGLSKGQESLTKGSSKGQETLSEGLANPPKHKTKNKTKNKEVKGVQGENYPFDDETFIRVWREFLDMRIDQNPSKPLNFTSINAQFDQFKEWGLETTIKAIRESIRNDWKGIFPPKDQRGQIEASRDLSDPLAI